MFAGIWPSLEGEKKWGQGVFENVIGYVYRLHKHTHICTYMIAFGIISNSSNLFLVFKSFQSQTLSVSS